MDIISAIIGGIFIALLIGAALFFGFTLLMIILIAAGLLAAATMIRQFWLRHTFVQGARKREKEGTTVIDAEFEEIKPTKHEK